MTRFRKQIAWEIQRKKLKKSVWFI
jgi:hypothetical protein